MDHLSSHMLEKIRNTSKAIVDKRLKDRDKKRGDNDRDFRIQNQMVGMVGETAAYEKYIEINPEAKMDTEVWNRPKFGGDLDQYTHVKTCHTRAKGGPLDSWTCDKKDPIITGPEEDDAIILVYANEQGEYEIVGFVWAMEVQNLWKPTAKLPWKVALYRPDIEDKICSNWETLRVEKTATGSASSTDSSEPGTDSSCPQE